MQEEIVVTKFQRYFRRVLLLLAGMLAAAVWVIVAVCGYRAYIGHGGMILTRGGGSWETGENGRKYLHFPMVVNGSSINVALPADYQPEDGDGYCYLVTKGTSGIGAQLITTSAPVILSSDRFGQLKLTILNDLENGRWRVEDTGHMELVGASKYRVGQVNLLYQFFGHHSSIQYKDGDWALGLGSWTLAMPEDQPPKGIFFLFVISVIILLKLYSICRIDRNPIYIENYNRDIAVKMAVGILAVLFLSVFVPLMNVVTFL